MLVPETSLHREAGRILENLARSVSESEFGYRIQGFAASVLVRMGAKVIEVNNQGHPDVIARSEGGFIRAEVEADLGSDHDRRLTADDLAAIRPRGPLDRGYFAVAMSARFPRWLIVPYERLKLRSVPASPAVMMALSDRIVSAAWTSELVSMLIRNQTRLPSLTYENLRRMALDGTEI